MKKFLLAMTAALVAIGVAVPVALSATNITDGLAVAPLYHYGPNPAGMTVPALGPRTLPSGLVTVQYNDGQDRFSKGHSRFTASVLVTNAKPKTKYVLDIRYWAFGPQSELGTLTTNSFGTGAALFSVSDVTPTPGFYIDISVKGGGTGAGGYGDTFIAGPFTLGKTKPTGGSELPMTLTVNGKQSTEITTAETVLYAGANAAPNATVGLTVFNGSGCTGAVAYNAPSYTTTDASGKYSERSGLTPVAGLYSSRTNVGSKFSNCVNIAVSAPAVNEFALSLAITPKTVAAGTVDPVTFKGTLTNHGTGVSGATVTVSPYSTDSTCTTHAPWGPWTATSDTIGHYETDPIPTGAPAGDYYYKASSNGVVSGCEHFTIGVTEVPAVDKATGNVNWVYGRTGSTGNVTFNAQGTKTSATGELAFTDSTGDSLNGVVTCFERINDTTAVFSGTITSGNPAYLAAANPYFIAKVVDNGAADDRIAVYANHGDACAGDVFGTDLADVTSGNLVVH